MPFFSETDQLGTEFRFLVDVMGYDLGSWSSCKGLGITFITVGLMSLGFMSFSGIQL